MLHLIFQSVIEHSIIQRIASGDDVVFIENAVFKLYKNNSLATNLLKMLHNDINICVLSEEIAIRGIDKNELVAGVKIVDYIELVQLTKKNKVIMTWN